MFAPYGDKFEVVEIDNIAVGDMSAHLQGVHAVMHVASPLPSKRDPKVLMEVSVPIHIILSAVLTRLSSGCCGRNVERHPPS